MKTSLKIEDKRLLNQVFVTALAFVLMSLSGCGGNGDAAPAANGGSAAGPAELTAFETEHGIGPITEPLNVGPIDAERAARGQEIFEMSCAACHQMQGRFVGPPLGDVTERRSPAFIVNMILNPEEMARRHPVVQEMLREYPVVMPYQNITDQQALDIVDYLRTYE
jgi:cytochrome c